MSDDIEYALKNLKGFRNSSGSFRAFEGQINGDLGELPDEWVERYRTDASLFTIAYTVMSYKTPIAWVLSDGDGVVHEVVIPKVFYSQTTASRHQSPCRRYLPFQSKLTESL
jgi:hypothetical protein